MKSIDLLEHGGATSDRPASYAYQGYVWPMEDPRERHYQWVLAALAVRRLPSMPRDIPIWKADLLFDRWASAWDLPEFESARRLAYLVDNYRAALNHDMATYAGRDLGDLWRARRWRFLLDIIDRLPSHSWYSAAVAEDEEHAQMLAESLAARPHSGAAEDKGPPLTTWTPEVAVLTSILDAVNRVQYATIAAQHGKKAGEPPKASRRPQTALERAMKAAEYRRRKAAHEALVARVLPQKQPVKGQSAD